jgi:phenylalanine-4-hydroxylase
LEYSVESPKPKRITFDPDVAANQEYPITEYQPIYFVADSFKKMKEQVMRYAETSMKRPFIARYNALTQSIEVLDSKDRILRYAINIRSEVSRLISALEKNV